MYNYIILYIIIFKYFSRQYRFIAYRQLTGWWELYYVIVKLQQSERSSHQNNMLDLVIRPLDISHPHIIVKDQHLIINNKVNFCVCK